MINYECKYRDCPYCVKVKVASIWDKENKPFIWVCKCPGRTDNGVCMRCNAVGF